MGLAGGGQVSTVPVLQQEERRLNVTTRVEVHCPMVVSVSLSRIDHQTVACSADLFWPPTHTKPKTERARIRRRHLWKLSITWQTIPKGAGALLAWVGERGSS